MTRLQQEVESQLVVIFCPCEKWHLVVAPGASEDEIKQSLWDHMNECVVLAASKIAALAP